MRGLAAAALVAAACGRSQTHCAEHTLAAAPAPAPPELDGKLEEPAWRAARPTTPFVDRREPKAVVPHTEARVLWDANALYVGFYVADEDIRSEDYVGLLVHGGAATYRFELSPSGALRCTRDGAACPALPGVRAVVDSDGTLDQPADDDEEWTAEMVIPWAAIGDAPGQNQLNFVRRDQTKGGPVRELVWTRECGEWGTLGRVLTR